MAEKVAQKLGYECISRDIILEASEEFNVPEIKLIRAIHDAPSILDKRSHEKDKFITYVQTALLKHFRKDNIVYHGLEGHYFVKGIPHVLKVLIVGSPTNALTFALGVYPDTNKRVLEAIDFVKYGFGFYVLSMLLLWLVGFLVIYPIVGFPEGILEQATQVLQSTAAK